MLDEGAIFDNDLIEEGDGAMWFGIGLTCEEMIKAQRPWCNRIIVKMISRSVGYHYLLRHIQTMWHIQIEPMLIDLDNDFFIVKPMSREEFIGALGEGPWMKGDNFLHMQHIILMQSPPESSLC